MMTGINKACASFKLTGFMLLALLLGACSESSGPANGAAPAIPEGIRLVERVTASGDEIIIPYSKFELANGLTLILHEDHSDPLVHVDVTYHVGSAREEPRRSGFAHLFEHMMFQGSRHVGNDEHFRIVTEAGGTMNGTTNTDRTNYFQTVPSNQLETMLWLESDRMGFFLEAVTEEKFEIQRDTVKNERDQMVENRPYGRFNEVNNAALYPPDHPYSWPVIGYPEDLDEADLDDLRNFFLRWYGPNNATLTIGGNINETEVLEMVNKYFGEIPRGPEVLPDSREPVSIDTDRYVSYVDPNIRFPALLFTFPTVQLDHPDTTALDALNSIITDGRRSVFYREFVLTRKAIQASGFNNNMELAGAITFFVMPFPGTPLSQFEEEMRAVFENFGPDSVSEEDIQIYRAQQEAALINRLASVRGKVSQLAYYQTFLDNPDNIRAELEAIRSLSREDVLRVFDSYIKDKPAVIQSVVPASAPDSQTRPDNFIIPARLERVDSDADDLELRVIESAFDRSVQPSPGPTPVITMPDYWQHSQANGIRMIGTGNVEIPVINLNLVFEGGHLLTSPEEYGLASLTASMMNEGTNSLSAEAFETELMKLGSSITVTAGTDNFTINVQSLERHFDATLELLEQRLFESNFTEEDLERLRQQQIEALEADKEQPSSIANNVYRQLLYGEDHSLSVAASGTPESLAGLNLEDVEDFRRRNLVSQALSVAIVANLPDTEIIRRLNFLNSLPNEGVSLREQPPIPEIAGSTIYLVDKPGSAQSEIRIGYMTELTYDPTGEYYERFLMNYVLGGAFNSRINLNLREDKGYTYGARSGFTGSKLPGPFTASAGVRTLTTEDSIRQFIHEITRYRDEGISASELAFTQSAILQREALDYETPRQKLGLLRQIINYDLDRNFVSRQQELIRQLSVERVNELARRHLPVEDMAILVVGDKAAIYESLQVLGYDIVELSVDGEVL